MYLSILILPLLGSTISGFLGRKIGVTGSHIIACSCLILSSILATIAFYEVGICGSPVSINLISWIDSELMYISWEFLFDQLTISMFIPVLYISSLIHIFSIDYMSEDPHNQRFFSYLSLFTFFMLLLVSGANYFVMFVGWEGILECLKWCEWALPDNNISECVICATTPSMLRAEGRHNKLTSNQRIGPHNLDILSMIIGSTLGDTHLEKRGKGTRIIFEQSNKNIEYLMWFHNYLSVRGYCNIQKPKLHKRIKKDGIFYHYRVNSYTFSSLNWIHDMFYTGAASLSQRQSINYIQKKIKIIPLNIEEYLTPLALAIWFMDDGSKIGNSARIATNCFLHNEIIFLSEVLYKKYNLKTSVLSSGINKGHIIYISTKSMTDFIDIVKPFMLPSLFYKLGLPYGDTNLWRSHLTS
jgi:hypothetical protein